MARKSPGRQVSALAAALAVAFGLFGSDAHALALGRVTVQSALGEPLRAEIDIPEINAEEAASLKTGVASPEAFKAAGLEYNPAMGSLQVSLQRRPDGRAYLRLSSERPISDPFIDLILETSWSSGRIVRDYTMLFDPPNLRQANAAPMAAAQLPAASPAASPRAMPAPMAAAPGNRPAPATPPAARAAAKAPPSGARQVTVSSGDTAGKIAAAHKPDQVSLDQMLVALLRANPDAFIGGNVNRIKAGSVLDIPTAEQAAAAPSSEASKTILAQSRDFNEFRRKLAQGAPETQLAAADRKAAGKLQASVEDKRPATAAPDKLTLSKGAVGAKAGEDKIASRREAQDTKDRVAELSRNVDELAKLQAASSAVGSVPAAAASAAAKSGVTVPVGAVTPAQPAATVAAPATAASAAKPAVAAAPFAVPAPAAAASAAETAVAKASQAATPATAKPAAAPPATEPDLLSELLDNPVLPAAAGGVIALLAGFGFYRARQRRKSAQVDSSFLESRLQPDSFFGSSGGQHVDTNEAAATGSSMVYSPSQLDAAGDVDPVAEADVYLAYGRDLQAEEILKEAMRSNPSRVAIHAKLLEIYAKRRDARAFEMIATEAYNLSSGEGSEWDKICELGRELDPDNPLYHPGGQPAPRPGAGWGGAATAAYAASTMPHSAHAELSSSPLTVDLNLDLDFSIGDEQTAPAPAQPSPVAAAAPLPFAPPARLNGAASNHAGLDMDFGAAPLSLNGAAAELPAPASQPIDLSVDLLIPEMPMDDAEPKASAAPADSGMIEFDLGALSLDLDAPAGAAAPASTDEAVDSDDPLATKLALAEEFRTLGDADGARALADEVLAQASGNLKTRAQRLIADLG